MLFSPIISVGDIDAATKEEENDTIFAIISELLPQSAAEITIACPDNDAIDHGQKCDKCLQCEDQLRSEHATLKAAFDLIEYLAENSGSSEVVTAIRNILRDAIPYVCVSGDDKNPVSVLDNDKALVPQMAVEAIDCNNNNVVDAVDVNDDLLEVNLDLTVFSEADPLLDDIDKNFIFSSNGAMNAAIIVQESFPAIGKFIHLYNESEYDVDIGGCVLKRISGEEEKSYEFSGEFVMKPKASIMVWPKSDQNRYYQVDSIFLEHEWAIGESSKIQLLTLDGNEIYSAEISNCLSHDVVEAEK